ncbi:DUF7266 family protein [Natrinema versiforme]|uniref:Flagellin n=1 Tax=Natrinema versiforme JCM 10478 TaxID=1227496 RepID=L9Y7M3_9EURY|nr:hypothetical protein [Natrinema versiforme]ELY70024.1 hypothetical protein C489_03716 [Natrinema versiforme JCM 10478]
MPTTGRYDERDRAVSITITHVLTIGITTILIAMLLTASGTMLESETERSADSSLETVGERIADEIGNVDQIANETDDTVTLTTEHPRTVASSRYTVELQADCNNAPLLEENTACVKLTAQDTDAVAHVPIKTDNDINETSSATGGTIEIIYESDKIRIRSWNQ